MKKRNLFVGFLMCFFVNIFAQTIKPVGINIASVSDYSTELVFTDAMKQSREWIPSNADGSGGWSSQVQVPINSNGYPLEIPYNNGIDPPQLLKTLMVYELGTAMPQGLYRLKVTGNGQVKLNWGASGTYNCPIDILVNVSGTSGVMMEILQSDVTNPISDIKFVLPDYVNSYQTQTFTTEFTDFIADFKLIRFMDFTQTNFSNIVSWSDRTPANYYTESKSAGASWESVVAIANTTQKDIWINIPHKADDNYILQLATLLNNTLNPTSKIYLEYSNEVWNGAFSQHADCAAFAQNLGYTGPEWERAWKYTAKRSADVFRIFENVFTNNQRFVKIIPSQAANSYVSNEIITFFNNPLYNPTQVQANALAIAPYFGGVADDIVASNQVNTITIPQILTLMQATLPTVYTWISDSKTVADQHNLDLIAYEGGQHLVGTGANVYNAALTAKLIQTNHDPGLQSLFCQYFNHWYNTVGKMFTVFSSHGTYSKYGSWGIRENFQDTQNPKYLSLQNCVFNQNILATSEVSILENLTIHISPNPVLEDFMVRNLAKTNENFEYYINDISGKIVLKGNSNFNKKISIKDFTKGIYFVTIKSQFGTKSFKIIKE